MDEVKDNAVQLPKKPRKSRQYYLYAQDPSGQYSLFCCGPFGSLVAARKEAGMNPEKRYMVAVKCETFEVKQKTVSEFKRI